MSAAAETRTPPITLELNPAGIPDDLKQFPQFLCWDWEWRDGKNGKPGKWTKPPVSPHREGHGSSTNPNTWAPFKIALKACQTRGLAGVGFVLHADDPFFFIDLDHCRDRESGELSVWAQRVLSSFSHTYQEISPSGGGMRIIGRGKLPGTDHVYHVQGERLGAKIEIFDQGKYTTLTGHRYNDATTVEDCQDALDKLYSNLFPPGNPEPRKVYRSSGNAPGDDRDLLERVRRSASGAQFVALFEHGDLTGHGGDHSAADQALCNMLAFWFGPDPERVDRVFRQSALMREKWDTKHYSDGRTYGQATVEKALAGRTEFYTARSGFRVFEGGRGGSPPPSDDQNHAQGEPVRRNFNITDTGNAERLVDRHGRNIRYNYGRGIWHVWTGTHWGEDKAGYLDQLAKETVRAIPTEAVGLDSEAWQKLMKWASTSEGAGKRAAMIDLARSEEGIPVQAEDLDKDPWLLNVANGTLDLRTGTLRAHDRADLITRCLNTPYVSEATCPTFLAFLDRIFAGNDELIGYVQRMFGYALTGSTREQVIFIAYGNGSNGKSTLLKTFANLLDDYAAEADTDTFLERPGDRTREDAAALDGVRFVAASETADGKRLSEAFIKKATGGEKIKARRLYENPYMFQPTCKIWLSTNHRPQITGTDHAIWRRIRMLPFTVTIPDNERDKDLPAKLEAEFPGILSWAVEGCRLWLAEGEQPTTSVLQATEQYRRDMDALANWIEDRCELRPNVRATGKDLYADYVTYCQNAGEEPLKQRTFGTRLTERGCGDAKSNGVRYRTGIRLRDPNQPTQSTFEDAPSDPERDTTRDTTDPSSRAENPTESSDPRSDDQGRDDRDEKYNNFSSDLSRGDYLETSVPYVPYVPEDSSGICSICGDRTNGESLCWSCR